MNDTQLFKPAAKHAELARNPTGGGAIVFVELFSTFPDLNDLHFFFYINQCLDVSWRGPGLHLLASDGTV